MVAARHAAIFRPIAAVSNAVLATNGSVALRGRTTSGQWDGNIRRGSERIPSLRDRMATANAHRNVLALVLVSSCLTGCEEEAQPPALSCEDQLAVDSASTSSFYDIAPDGGPSVRVFCDMQTDGGGWTLVARSGPTDGALAWGWGYATGAVDDFSRPYALGIGSVPLPFQELLIGDLDDVTGLVAARGYATEVPEDFIAAHPDDAVLVSPWRTVVGDCLPDFSESSSSMLQWAGHTGSDVAYVFRDDEINDQVGLRPGGWFLAEPTDGSACNRSGELHERHGQLLVR